MLEHLWEQNWEFQQNRNIRNAQGDAQRAGDKARTLESQVEGLVLLNQALVEILSERFGVREEEILAKVTEIDIRDGSQDGKIGGAIQCGQCSRPYSRRLQRCLYCGEANQDTLILSRIRHTPG